MKIFFSHDLMNKDPEKRKKITGIIFEFGYNCQYSCWCPYGAKCKYRGSYRFHNACVRIETFFQYRLRWKWFRIPFYIQSHSSDLSGTTKCPKGVARHKTCHMCKYSAGYRDCSNTERTKLIREGRHRELDCEERCCCKLFEPVDWFEEYDHRTGDYIYR